MDIKPVKTHAQPSSRVLELNHVLGFVSRDVSDHSISELSPLATLEALPILRARLPGF